jgi:DNA-binding Xre family transcriptional regulator
MRSKIKVLAKQKGITTPQQLSYAARITWPTAKKVWQGDLSKTWGETLFKLSQALECRFEDLFEVRPKRE